MYEFGKGVPADAREAVRWYRLAANQGFAMGQNNLGHMLNAGKGVLKDTKEAMRWLRLAANQGVTSAQYTLGHKYANGTGVLTDHISAHMWFNIANANGLERARERRDAVEKTMTAADISKAAKSARDCMSSDYQNCR